MGFCWLTLMSLTACNNDQTSITIDIVTVFPERTVRLPISLKSSEVTDLDSLENVILPIILPPSKERKLELWHGKKHIWLSQIGNDFSLQVYLQNIFENQIAAGEQSAAIITKFPRGHFFYLNALYPEAIIQYQESLEISTRNSDSIMNGWSYLNLSSSLLQMKDLANQSKTIVESRLQVLRSQINTIDLFSNSGPPSGTHVNHLPTVYPKKSK